MKKATSLVVTHKRPALLRETLWSISKQVLPTYWRHETLVLDDADDTGSVAAVCAEFPNVRRVYRANRKVGLGWGNAAIPFNIGIKEAQGDVVVMQSGDVMYTKPTDLEKLLAPHVDGDERIVTLATCEKIGEPDGVHFTVRAGDQEVLLFSFGCAFNRNFALALGGFEESYAAWGFEEDDLALLMLRHGAKVKWFAPEVVCTHHQYHTWVPNNCMNTPQDREAFRLRRAAIEAGHLANEGRAWGIDQ